MRLRTLNNFQDQLDKDFGWRLREIAAIKATTSAADGLAQVASIRSGIPLLYAHWEGFVKFGAETYVRYVGAQGLSYADLSNEFIVFGAKGHLHHLAESRKASVNVAAVSFFTEHLDEPAALNWRSAIRTDSNLSSGVFANILLSVGIQPKQYSARFNFIDSSLVDRRNRIAHGEYLDLDESSFTQIADEVLALLRNYKVDLEQAAISARYKRETGV